MSRSVVLVVVLAVVGLCASSAGAAARACTIVGTSGDDVLHGTAGRDVICAGEGDDVIYAGGGNDVVYGGRGNDVIYGGGGNDTIHAGRGDDVVHGGDGRDTIVGGRGHDTILRGNGDPWEVGLQPYYELPIGTNVHYQYDPGPGNCLDSWVTAYDETVKARSGAWARLMTAKSGGSCDFQRSRGYWYVTITTPSGTTKTVHIMLETGSPNIEIHSVDSVCAPVVGLPCSGGSDWVDVKQGLIPLAPLHIGPITEDPTPPDPGPRVDPQLICNAHLLVAVGQTLDQSNAHFCTINGNPRPTVTFKDLPPGMTAARWPNPITDSWLVGEGRIDVAGTWQVRVDARLPSGWSDTKFVSVEARAG